MPLSLPPAALRIDLVAHDIAFPTIPKGISWRSSQNESTCPFLSPDHRAPGLYKLLRIALRTYGTRSADGYLITFLQGYLPLEAPYGFELMSPCAKCTTVGGAKSVNTQ